MASPSGVSQSRWAEAYNALKQKHKDELIFTFTQPVDPQEVLDVVRKQSEDGRLQRWRARLPNGEIFVLHDGLEKISKWVQCFIKVGDAAMQYDPGHAALPWAALRFVLQVSVNNFETHAMIVESFDQLTHLLAWTRTQELLMANSANFFSSEASKAIVSLYAAALAFLAKAKRFVRESKMKRAIKSIFLTERSYIRYKNMIETNKKVVQDNIQQATLQELQQLGRPVNQQYSDIRELKRMLRNLEAPLQRFEQSSKSLGDVLTLVSHREQNEILDWISDISYGRHHSQINRKALQGTGTWLHSNPKFLSWVNSSLSQIMWLRGIPGSGKSVLLSMQVQHLIQQHNDYGGAYPLYFYCSKSTRDMKRSDPEQILRCLVQQASSIPGGPQLHSKTRLRYEQRRKAGQLSIEEAIGLLMSTVERRPVTYIFLDALDECERETRHELTKALEIILNDSPSLIKIFVSSRDDQDIVLSLDNYPSVVIDASENQHDIALYVLNRTQTLIDEKRLLGAHFVTHKLRNSICERLCEGAQGMFRWVELQLDYLCTLNRPSAVESRLGSLPKKLGQIYENLFDRNIEQQDPQDRDITWRTFCWLLSAQTKLRAKELITLLSAGNASASDMNTGNVLDLCFNLVQYDERLDEFRFSHSSVREFLETYHLNYHASRANLMAMNTCLTVLEKQGLEYESALDYAFYYWAQHASLANTAQTTQTHMVEQLDSFLRPTSQAFCWWSRLARKCRQGYLCRCDDQNMHALDGLCQFEQRLEDQLKFHYWVSKAKRVLMALAEPPHPLLAACAWNLARETRNLISNLSKADVSEIRNTDGGTGLYVASLFGGAETVSVFAEADMAVDIVADQKPMGGDALYAAVSGGHSETAQRLLNWGVGTKISRDSKKAASVPAARNSDEKVFQMVFDEDVNADVQANFFNELLSAAADGSSQNILRNLLDDKFIHHHSASVIQNALEDACVKGNEPIVRQLLIAASNRSFDLDLICEEALGGAANEGHANIVRLLLDAGVNPDVRYGSRETPLCQACYNSQFSTAKLLLERGADVNGKYSEYGQPLFAVCESEDSDAALRLLLAYDLNVNLRLAVSSDGHSFEIHDVLDGAMKLGNTATVRLLLEHHTSPSRKFVLASKHGQEDVVRLWLERGTDFDCGFQATAEKGHQRVSGLLLRNDADIDAAGDLGSALEEALAHGNRNIAKMILETGAKLGSTLNAVFIVILWRSIFLYRWLPGKSWMKIKNLLIDYAAKTRSRGKDASAIDFLFMSGHAQFMEDLTKQVSNLGHAFQWAYQTRQTERIESILGQGSGRDTQFEFKRAAIVGRDWMALFLIDCGADIGDTLCVACRKGRVGIVWRLLKRAWVAIDAPSTHVIPGLESCYYNPLHAAASFGDRKLIELLLRKGAKINTACANGTTLQCAAMHGRQDSVKVLLKNGATLGANADKYLLWRLSNKGYDKIIDMLLDYGIEFVEPFEGIEDLFNEEPPALIPTPSEP